MVQAVVSDTGLSLLRYGLQIPGTGYGSNVGPWLDNEAGRQSRVTPVPLHLWLPTGGSSATWLAELGTRIGTGLRSLTYRTLRVRSSS